VNRYLTGEEAAYIVDDCGAKVLVTSAALGDVAVDVAKRTPGCAVRLMADGAADGFDSYEDAVAAHERPEGMDCLGARDALLEDRRDEGLEDRAGPAETEPREPPGEVGDDRMKTRLEAGRIVVEAKERRQPVEDAVRAGAPGLGLESSSAGLHEERRGAVRGPRRPGRGDGAEAHRRVAAAPHEGSQNQPEVERGVEVDRPSGHRCPRLSPP